MTPTLKVMTKSIAQMPLKVIMKYMKVIKSLEETGIDSLPDVALEWNFVLKKVKTSTLAPKMKENRRPRI